MSSISLSQMASTPTTSRLKSSAIEKSKLELLGIRTINILVPSKAKDPAYYTFPQCDGYKESPTGRNMRPTFHHLLELARSANFELERSGNWQERPSLR
jgi:acetyl-CoA carboxylase/biotin carboxylase 1